MNIKATAASLASSTFLFTCLAVLPAHAAGLTYATSVDSYTKGSNGNIADDRDNPEAALGAPGTEGSIYNPATNTKFLSLGLGGEAVFSFGTLFQGSVRLWETTWGNYSRQSGFDEQVDVYAQAAGSTQWELLRRVKNILDGANTAQGASITLSEGKVYQKLKLVDKSAQVKGRDGWDVAAIGVEAVPSQAVPEPSILAGLVLSVGVLATRRRKSV